MTLGVTGSQGGVVTWWNMDRNGGYDVLTKHGGCPVAIGSKWIANKWVRAHGQMFRRPCPRYPIEQILNSQFTVKIHIFKETDLKPSSNPFF